MAEISIAVNIHVSPHQVGDGEFLGTLLQTLAAALTVQSGLKGCPLQLGLLGLRKSRIFHDRQVEVHLVEGCEPGDDRVDIGILQDPF